MRYTVTAPAAGFSGDIAGVVFRDGTAVAEDGRHKAALAYFRRRGYTVEPESAPEPVTEQVDEKPKKSASKAAWAAYAVAHGMSAEEADELTRDQLVERFSDEGEDQ